MNSANFSLLLMRLFTALPLVLTTRFVYALAWLAGFLPLSINSALRAIYVNLLVTHPDAPPDELKKLARRTLCELSWTLVDCAHSWTHDAATNLARIHQVHGYDALKDAMQSERPVLLLSLHQSSWELPNLTVGELGAVTVFYQPSDNPAFNELVTNAREGTGSTLVPANARGMKAAIQAMGRGDAVAILADHNPGNAKGNPWVDFFGQPVRTSGLPAKLMLRYKPRLFFACANRVKGKVEAHFIEADESLYQETDTELLLAKMNAGLADMIQRAPSQYQWTYKRFHRTPAGRRPLYKDSIVPLLNKLPADRDAVGLGRFSPESTERLVEIAANKGETKA